MKYFTDNFLQCLTKQKEVDSHNQLEKDEALKKSLEDLEAKNKEVSHLENQVKELEQKLQEADAKLLEKVSLYPSLSIEFSFSKPGKISHEKVKLEIKGQWTCYYTSHLNVKIKQLLTLRYIAG